MKTRIVEVTWLDAATQHDEISIEKLPSPSTVRTFGILVKRTEEGVWVASERLTDPQKDSVTYRCTTVIPAGILQKVKTLGYEDV